MASFRDIASTPGDADVLQTSLEELHRRRQAKLLEERERQRREQSRLFGEDTDSWSTAQELAYRRDVLKTWAATYPKLREAVAALTSTTAAATAASPARSTAPAPVFSVADTVRAAYPPLWSIPAGTVPPSFYADASAAAMEVVSSASAARSHTSAATTAASATTGSAPPASSAGFVVKDYSGEACLVRVRREALQPAGNTTTTSTSTSNVTTSFTAALPQRVLARWPDGKPASAKANAVLRSIDIEERKRKQWNAHVRRQQQPQQSNATTTVESFNASRHAASSAARGGSDRRYDAIRSVNSRRSPLVEANLSRSSSSSSSTASYSVGSSIHPLDDASAPATAGQPHHHDDHPPRSRSERGTDGKDVSGHRVGGSGHRHHHDSAAAGRGCSVEAGAEDTATAGHVLYWPAYVTRTRALFTGAACLQDTFHGLGRLQRHERFEPVLALALASPVRIVVDVVYAIDETTEALGLSIDPAVNHEDGTPVDVSAAASAAAGEAVGQRSGSHRSGATPSAAPSSSSALIEANLPVLLPSSLPPVLSDLNAGFTAGPTTGVATAAPASISVLGVVAGASGRSGSGAGARRNRATAADSRWTSALTDDSGTGASTLNKGGAVTAVLRRSALATSPASAYALLAGPVSQTHSMVLLRPTPEVVCAARAQALQELEQRWRRLRQALINRLVAYEETAPHAVAPAEDAPAAVSSIRCSRSSSQTSSHVSLPSDVLAGTSLPPTFIEPTSPLPTTPSRSPSSVPERPSALSPVSSSYVLSVQLPDAETYESPYLDRSARHAARLPAQPTAPVELTPAEMRQQTCVPQLQGGRLPRRPLTYQVEEAPSASVSSSGRLRLSNTSVRSPPLDSGLPPHAAWGPPPRLRVQPHASPPLTARVDGSSASADTLSFALSHAADTSTRPHLGDGPRRWSGATAHPDSSAAPLEESRRLSAAVRAAAARRRAVEDAVHAQQRHTTTAPRAALPVLTVATPSLAAAGNASLTAAATTTTTTNTATALTSPPSATWKAATRSARSRAIEKGSPAAAAAAATGDHEASPCAHTPPPRRQRVRAVDATSPTSHDSAGTPRPVRSLSFTDDRIDGDGPDRDDEDAAEDGHAHPTTSGVERYSAIFASSARSVPETPLQEASLTSHVSWEAASPSRSAGDRKRDGHPQPPREGASGTEPGGPAATTTPSRRPLPARGRTTDVLVMAPLSTPSSDPPLSVHVSGSVSGGGGGINASSFTAMTPLTVHASPSTAGTPPPAPPSHAASPFGKPPASAHGETSGALSSAPPSAPPPPPRAVDVSHAAPPVGRLQLLTPLQSPLAAHTHALLAMVEPPSSSRVSTVESASQRSATQPPQSAGGGGGGGPTATTTPAHRSRCDTARRASATTTAAAAVAHSAAATSNATTGISSSLSDTADSVEVPLLRSTAAYAGTGRADPPAAAVAVKSAAPQRAAGPAASTTRTTRTTASTSLSPQPSPPPPSKVVEEAASRSSSSTPPPPPPSSSRSLSLRDQRQLQLRNLENPQRSTSPTTSLREDARQPQLSSTSAHAPAHPVPAHVMPPSPRSLAESAALAAAAAAAAPPASSRGVGAGRVADASPPPRWDGGEVREGEAAARVGVVVVEVEAGNGSAAALHPSAVRQQRSAPVFVVEVGSRGSTAAHSGGRPSPGSARTLRAHAEHDTRTHGSPLQDDGQGSEWSRSPRHHSRHHHHHRHRRGRSSEAATLADSPLPRRPQQQQQQQPVAVPNASIAPPPSKEKPRQEGPAHTATRRPRSPAWTTRTSTAVTVEARERDGTAPPPPEQPESAETPLPLRYPSLSIALSDGALSASVNREVELPGQSARLPSVLSLRTSPTTPAQAQQQQQQQPQPQRGRPGPAPDLVSAYASSVPASVESRGARAREATPSSSPALVKPGDTTTDDVAVDDDDDDDEEDESYEDQDAYSDAEGRAEARRRSTHIIPSRRASHTRRASGGGGDSSRSSSSSTDESRASLPLPASLPEQRPPSSSAAFADSSEEDDGGDDGGAAAVALPAPPPRGRPTAAPASSTTSSISSWGAPQRGRPPASHGGRSRSPDVEEDAGHAVARRRAPPPPPPLQLQPPRRRSAVDPDARPRSRHGGARSARRGGAEVGDSDDGNGGGGLVVVVGADDDNGRGAARSSSPASSSARHHTVLVRRVVRRRRSEVFVEEGGTLVYRAPMSAASTPRRISGEHPTAALLTRPQRSTASSSSYSTSMPHAQLQLTAATPSSSSSVQQRVGH